MKEDWKEVFPVKSAQDHEELLGSVWLVEDIDGRGVVDRAQTTVEFARDGSVSGNTGVNRYFGKATLEGDALSFGPLATTRRAGPPALMDQERRFLEAMKSVTKFEGTALGIIQFLDGSGNAVLSLSRKTP
jgi:heat shock protein HslJ